MSYKMITERSHLFAPNINICFVVEFCNAVEVGALQKAINMVEKQHPILRSSVKFDEKGNTFYDVTEEVKVEVSLVRITDDKGWITVVAQEQEKPFILSEAPLIRFTCVKDGINMQLVMCVHHILADGLSCIKILQDIMTCVNGHNQTIKVQHPNLLEDTVLYDNEKLSIPVRILVDVLNKQWSKESHIFTESEYYTMRQNYWSQRSHTIEVAELNEKQTSQLISKCKKYKVTVNNLLVATLLESAERIHRKNAKIGIAASIRPKETGVGNFASGISIKYRYNRVKSLWENVSKIQKLANKRLRSEKAKAYFLTLLKALNLNLIDSMYFSLFGDFKSKPTRTLRKILGYNKNPFGLGMTNLGKISISTGNGVKSVFFIPPLIANTDKIVGVVTTDSGLRIAYQYLNQVNIERNKQIFHEWIIRLKNL